MDPTANLAMQRSLAKLIIADDANYAHAAELAEHVEALDEWISNGGFLPSQWPTPASPEGLREAAQKIESIVDDNDVYGILRAFDRADVADELVDWVTQLSAHRIQS